MLQPCAKTNKKKDVKANDRSLFQLLDDDPTILDAIMDQNIVENNQQNEGWPDLNKQIDNKTKQQLLEQDIKFDYVKNLSIITQQNRLNFTPSQRSAQYRFHLKQPIEQIVKFNNLRDQNVCLSYNKFNPEQIKAYLQYNSGSSVDNTIQIGSLFMAWARSHTIVHFLALKKFQNMTSLNIAANFIGSLELLSRVEMPALQDIYLWKNNITQVRSLKHCKWPNIRNIDLHINYIAQIKDLRYLGSKTLESIVLDNCLITNQHEAVVTCSGSPKSRISLHCNYLIKYIGRPKERRRKKAIDFQPCLMKVRYV